MLCADVDHSAHGRHVVVMHWLWTIDHAFGVEFAFVCAGLHADAPVVEVVSDDDEINTEAETLFDRCEEHVAVRHSEEVRNRSSDGGSFRDSFLPRDFAHPVLVAELMDLHGVLRIQVQEEVGESLAQHHAENVTCVSFFSGWYRRRKLTLQLVELDEFADQTFDRRNLGEVLGGCGLEIQLKHENEGLRILRDLEQMLSDRRTGKAGKFLRTFQMVGGQDISARRKLNFTVVQVQ